MPGGQELFACRGGRGGMGAGGSGRGGGSGRRRSRRRRSSHRRRIRCAPGRRAARHIGTCTDAQGSPPSCWHGGCAPPPPTPVRGHPRPLQAAGPPSPRRWVRTGCRLLCPRAALGWTARGTPRARRSHRRSRLLRRTARRRSCHRRVGRWAGWAARAADACCLQAESGFWEQLRRVCGVVTRDNALLEQPAFAPLKRLVQSLPIHTSYHAETSAEDAPPVRWRRAPLAGRRRGSAVRAAGARRSQDGAAAACGQGHHHAGGGSCGGGGAVLGDCANCVKARGKCPIHRTAAAHRGSGLQHSRGTRAARVGLRVAARQRRRLG